MVPGLEVHASDYNHFHLTQYEKQLIRCYSSITPVWSDEKDLPFSVFPVALRKLHSEDYDREFGDIVKEKNNLASSQAKKPWELLSDRSLCWQLLTIMLLNCAQQLNGINAVCSHRWAFPVGSVYPLSYRLSRG